MKTRKQTGERSAEEGGHVVSKADVEEWLALFGQRLDDSEARYGREIIEEYIDQVIKELVRVKQSPLPFPKDSHFI